MHDVSSSGTLRLEGLFSTVVCNSNRHNSYSGQQQPVAASACRCICAFTIACAEPLAGQLLASCVLHPLLVLHTRVHIDRLWVMIICTAIAQAN